MSRINLNKLVQLHCDWSEEIAELTCGVDGMYRLKTRQLIFVGPPQMFALKIMKRPKDYLYGNPIFGVVQIDHGPLHLAINCSAEAIDAAHRAFPALPFHSLEVAHV